MGKVFFKIKLFLLTISTLVFIYFFTDNNNKFIIKDRVAIIQHNEQLNVRLKEVAISFLGTPYLENSLNRDTTEKLVVRFDSLDCMTFVENCVALTLLSQQKKISYKSYEKILQNLRYRNGIIDGYGSRIHYFLEWKQNLQNRRIVSDFSEYFDGTSHQKNINFLSTRKNLSNKDREEILKIEQLISRPFFCISKDSFLNVEKKLVDGDIVGLVSNEDNLDIKHMGIIILENNVPHLIHSSKRTKQVEISKESLYEYIMRDNKIVGVILLRIQKPL